MKGKIANHPIIVEKKKRQVVVPAEPVKTKPVAKTIEPTEKPQPKKPIKDIMAILSAAYPQAFGHERKPLKVRIHQDLLQSTIREKLSYMECRNGIHYRISGIKYLESWAWFRNRCF